MNTLLLKILVICGMAVLTIHCSFNQALGNPQLISKKLAAQKDPANKHHQRKIPFVKYTHAYQLIPERAGLYDSLYYVTKFPAMETGDVTLTDAELKLNTFDTSALGLYFVVCQITDLDTFLQEIPVDITQLEKHNKLQLDLSSQQINLKPAPFFLGYRFKLKKTDGPYTYDVMSLQSDGITANIWRTPTGYKIRSTPGLGFLFPFKMTYVKAGPGH